LFAPLSIIYRQATGYGSFFPAMLLALWRLGVRNSWYPVAQKPMPVTNYKLQAPAYRLSKTDCAETMHGILKKFFSRVFRSHFA
jgi:hypothetical protein